MLAGPTQVGCTLIELLVVISITALLVVILVPSLASARRQSKKSVCLSNLKQIGTGMRAYLDENRNFYPYASMLPSVEADVANLEGRSPYVSLPEALEDQLRGGAKVFRCPADRNTLMDQPYTPTYFESEGTSYEWISEHNGQKEEQDPMNVSLGRKSSQLVWDYEPFHGGPNKAGSHHVLYVDLSVREDKWDPNRHVSGDIPGGP